MQGSEKSIVTHGNYSYLLFPGGIAGAASRITGAMAKGVAAITMDEDYQQKRREAMNRQPSSLREGLTRGGKGLVSVRIQTGGDLLSHSKCGIKVASTSMCSTPLVKICSLVH